MSERGKVVKPPGTVFYRDHFVFPGKVVLKLPPGQYSFEIERGPSERKQADGLRRSERWTGIHRHLHEIVTVEEVEASAVGAPLWHPAALRDLPL